MKEKKFLKLRLIWNIIRRRPVICNATFRGGFTLVSENGYIVNNTFIGGGGVKHG